MERSKKHVHVYVVSDATGITAERVIRAVLVQFGKQVEPVVERYGYVKSTQQLDQILDLAESSQGVVIYSLVARSLRDWIKRQRHRRNLEIIDLLGPLIDRMVKLFNVMPVMHPGLLGLLGEASVRLAESIDFTLRHDDGQGRETLGFAEVILIGVSRTSKTPTSLYLSCNHNLKVANVPIVFDLNPPAKIFTLKKPRKVGLTIEPEKLASIRRRRYKKTALPGYTDLKSINKELAYSHKIFDRIPGIQIIDVTNTSIEEIAKQIVQESSY